MRAAEGVAEACFFLFSRKTETVLRLGGAIVGGVRPPPPTPHHFAARAEPFSLVLCSNLPCAILLLKQALRNSLFLLFD